MSKKNIRHHFLSPFAIFLICVIFIGIAFIVFELLHYMNFQAHVLALPIVIVSIVTLSVFTLAEDKKNTHKEFKENQKKNKESKQE